MFEARKAAVEDEMKQLEKTLDMLKFKCWYYEKAMEDDEDGIHAMLPDNLPLRSIYDNSHDSFSYMRESAVSAIAFNMLDVLQDVHILCADLKVYLSIGLHMLGIAGLGQRVPNCKVYRMHSCGTETPYFSAMA